MSGRRVLHMGHKSKAVTMSTVSMNTKQEWCLAAVAAEAEQREDEASEMHRSFGRPPSPPVVADGKECCVGFSYGPFANGGCLGPRSSQYPFPGAAICGCSYAHGGVQVQ
eukprot:scaffold536472_cov34-Prasinocladus_malaysianus.AAC.1